MPGRSGEISLDVFTRMRTWSRRLLQCGDVVGVDVFVGFLGRIKLSVGTDELNNRKSLFLAESVVVGTESGCDVNDSGASIERDEICRRYCPSFRGIRETLRTERRTSMRILMLRGFDASAKVILRSTSEHIQMLVAIITDPMIATEFAKTRHPNTAAAFWRKHVRRGALQQQMKKAWTEFFSG